MKAFTPPGAADLIRSVTPSPYATGITPWLFSHSWLPSLARPMTVAPVRRASWTASEPTPPAAPEMTMVSPSFGWTACTAPHAVTPATYRPPATSHETFSGLRVRSPASTRTSSAWEARLFVNPITSSPGENPPAPAPTFSMTPARSLPCPDGNVEGNSCATAPVRMTASLGLMPAAFTRTRTCPSPGAGRSTSSTRSTSIPPNSSYLIAFTMTSLSLDPLKQQLTSLPAASLTAPGLLRGSLAARPRLGHARCRPGLAGLCRHAGAGLRWRRVGCGGRRTRLSQRPAADQGAADDRAAGEDPCGPPERGGVAVQQRLPSQGLAADQPGRGEMCREVGGDGGGEDAVQQGGADRGAELLADVECRGRDSRVLRGHAERAGVDRRGEHHAHADPAHDGRAEHTRGVAGVRGELGEPDRSACGGQQPERDQRPGPYPRHQHDRGEVGRDDDAAAERQERDAGDQRRVAERLLQVVGQEQEGPEQPGRDEQH